MTQTKTEPKNKPATAPTSEEESKPRLRIRIRAYDHKIIDQAVRTILDTALRAGAQVVGPIPLPTERSLYTVIRSSFIDKNSQEQYEMKVHKRLLDIMEPNPKTIDALTNLNLPAGVDVEIKM